MINQLDCLPAQSSFRLFARSRMNGLIFYHAFSVSTEGFCSQKGTSLDDREWNAIVEWAPNQIFHSEPRIDKYCLQGLIAIPLSDGRLSSE